MYNTKYYANSNFYGTRAQLPVVAEECLGLAQTMLSIVNVSAARQILGNAAEEKNPLLKPETVAKDWKELTKKIAEVVLLIAQLPSWSLIDMEVVTRVNKLMGTEGDMDEALLSNQLDKISLSEQLMYAANGCSKLAQAVLGICHVMQEVEDNDELYAERLIEAKGTLAREIANVEVALSYAVASLDLNKEVDDVIEIKLKKQGCDFYV